jgi:hypothetical protein
MFNPEILNVKTEEINNDSTTVTVKFEDTMHDSPRTNPNIP